jgi:hypothetical protein
MRHQPEVRLSILHRCVYQGCSKLHTSRFGWRLKVVEARASPDGIEALTEMSLSLCGIRSKRVNPYEVKAEFKNGMLYLTAEIAQEARVKKVKLGAA